MLELGIDEITVVLQLSPDVRAQITDTDWQKCAEIIIYRFVHRSGFKTIFGDAIPEKTAPAGYTVAFTYGEHNFYLAVAYHQEHIRQGVVIKFSARALDYYREASGLDVYDFLQNITDDYYTFRLSRADLTLDYLDEDIDVTGIYQDYMNKKIGVFRELLMPS